MLRAPTFAPVRTRSTVGPRDLSRHPRDPAALGFVLAEVVEAGATQCWWRYVGSTGRVLGIDRFGASGKAADLFREYGLTAANVTQAVEALLAS